MTLWVEGEMVKFFEGTGREFQTQMAEVLAAFMHARLADGIAGAEGVGYAPSAGRRVETAPFRGTTIGIGRCCIGLMPG